MHISHEIMAIDIVVGGIVAFRKSINRIGKEACGVVGNPASGSLTSIPGCIEVKCRLRRRGINKAIGKIKVVPTKVTVAKNIAVDQGVANIEVA